MDLLMKPEHIKEINGMAPANFSSSESISMVNGDTATIFYIGSHRFGNDVKSNFYGAIQCEGRGKYSVVLYSNNNASVIGLLGSARSKNEAVENIAKWKTNALSKRFGGLKIKPDFEEAEEWN